ncbi:hypothetical protein AVEN_189716-1 [Araneus ventricosus]|uniref:Uncharacterized protein n=1 Tax=Araneus ventricosus TaxID=182803 RepID=A0A4Y2J1G9_ARAVE|nr:hypothetical protein AVEN_189716-1 [Araneus ventricosus]
MLRPLGRDCAYQLGRWARFLQRAAVPKELREVYSKRWAGGGVNDHPAWESPIRVVSSQKDPASNRVFWGVYGLNRERARRKKVASGLELIIVC